MRRRPPMPSLAELPLDQQTEQKLDPLTKEDVDLYLKVMRAAAERVKNLTPGGSGRARWRNENPRRQRFGTRPHARRRENTRARNLVAISMDQIVAEEMKLDGRTYRGIVEAIESVIPNPAIRRCLRRGPCAHPPDHTPTPLEKRLNEVNAANEKFLAPYRRGDSTTDRRRAQSSQLAEMMALFSSTRFRLCGFSSCQKKTTPAKAYAT